MSYPARPIRERFWAKVDRRGPDECWPWLGYRTPLGYGMLSIPGPGRRSEGAHRLAYEFLVAPIPSGMDLDHLCHGRDLSCEGGRSCLHRGCVNPAHLEPVTPGENVRRGRHSYKSHCIHGHELTDENTVVRKGGYRECRTCLNERARRVWASRVYHKVCLFCDAPFETHKSRTVTCSRSCASSLWRRRQRDTA